MGEQLPHDLGGAVVGRNEGSQADVVVAVHPEKRSIFWPVHAPRNLSQGLGKRRDGARLRLYLPA